MSAADVEAQFQRYEDRIRDLLAREQALTARVAEAEGKINGAIDNATAEVARRVEAQHTKLANTIAVANKTIKDLQQQLGLMEELGALEKLRGAPVRGDDYT